MRSSSNSGKPERPSDRAQTEHPKRHHRHCPNGLYIVGIGPGDLAQLSQRARDVLLGAHTIVGYGVYVDLIQSLLADQTIIQTGMTKEVDRVSTAIDLAGQGKAVALISSGDPGIYAMAGLAFEICATRSIPLKAVETITAQHACESNALAIEVVPGIPALCAGAALLGAPLTHDFAAISMSDLLTPWQVIEKRIHAAAGADFVMVIYNPKSKKRHWQLEKAQQITLAYRSGDTPVGLVTKAMRNGQHIEIIPLSKLHTADVNMQTTVFIGNSTTAQYGNFLYTLRGYGKKYALTD